MSAPMRIERTPVARTRAIAPPGAAKDEEPPYLEKLTRLIPGEVIGLYLVGVGLIPKGQGVATVCWSVFCAIVLVIVRVKGTSDREQGKGPQWTAIVIALISYVIWLYALGGPFVAFPASASIHVSYVASLLVLGWTFIVPYFFRAEPTVSAGG